nr:E3 SUMO-protein ligase ZBED1-like [Nothobranchius furzeri]
MVERRTHANAWVHFTKCDGYPSLSIIWNWFGFSPDDKEQRNVICKVCKESVKASDGNTTNLFNHLKRRHPKQYNESQLAAKAKKPAAAAASASSRQQTLTETLTKLTPYDRDSRRWNSVTDAVTYHLVKDLCPVRTVGVGFKKMIKTFDPRYKFSSRKYFSNTAIPRMYAECKVRVAENIQNAQLFATTSDLWSSCTSEPYLSLTIHYMSNWELRSILNKLMFAQYVCN